MGLWLGLGCVGWVDKDSGLDLGCILRNNNNNRSGLVFGIKINHKD